MYEMLVKPVENEHSGTFLSPPSQGCQYDDFTKMYGRVHKEIDLENRQNRTPILGRGEFSEKGPALAFIRPD